MSDDEKNKKESLSNTTVQIESTSIPYPPFWERIPQVWFEQLDAWFVVKKVTSDNSKYYHAISALPAEIIASISHVIRDVHNDTEKYQKLRAAVIKIKSLSEAQRIEELLAPSGMGNQKPSAFYRLLEQTAGKSDAVNSLLLRKIWLKKLPESIRSIVVLRDNDPIDEQIDLADKIWEINTPSSSSINAYSKPSTSSNVQSEITLESLAKAIAELQTKIERQCNYNITRENNYRSRSRSQGRSYNRSRSRGSNRNNFSSNGNYVCWYHKLYASKARKCKGNGCSFEKLNSNPQSKN